MSNSETSYGNHNKISTKWKKILIQIVAIVIFIICIALLYFSIPLLQSVLKGFKTAEIISIIAIVLTVFSIIYKSYIKIISSIYDKKKAINLNVTCEDNYSIITCKISNKDTRRIIPQNIYLFLEKGIESNEFGIPVDFSFLLHHDKGKCDCALGIECKEGNLKNFPENIVEKKYCQQYHSVFRLDQLCSESRRYIDPGEEFSEDLIIKLEKGVYRATVVWTSVDDDCICTTKQFIVNPICNVETNISEKEK